MLKLYIQRYCLFCYDFELDRYALNKIIHITATCNLIQARK